MHAQKFSPKRTKISVGVAMWTLFLSLTLSACSGGHNPDLAPAPISGKQTVITGTPFEILEMPERSSSVPRQTLFLATQPLVDARSAAHFQFTVDLQPGGEATLLAFGEKTPTSLAKAIEIRVQRLISSGALTVSITASGTTDDWSDFFKDLDPEKPIHLGVDIHNDESGEAHVLIWDLQAGDRPNLPTLVDSAMDVNGSPGKGFGRHWGIALLKGELTLANVTVPRYDH